MEKISLGATAGREREREKKEGKKKKVEMEGSRRGGERGERYSCRLSSRREYEIY